MPKTVRLRSIYDKRFIYSGIYVDPGEEFDVKVTPKMAERNQDAEWMANHLVNERGWCEYVNTEEGEDG